MKFIILHGTLGKPTHNWYPSLAEKLEKQGHTTILPQLPTPVGQNLPTWVHTITNTVDSLNTSGDDLVIVAHSMSPFAVCHYLTTRTSSIAACFFVAGFGERLPSTPEPYPTLNNPFVDTPVDWDLVKKNGGKFFCFGSDNDPYVPLSITKNFARNLEASFTLVPDAGHFNTASGYKDFPLLLSAIITHVPQSS